MDHLYIMNRYDPDVTEVTNASNDESRRANALAALIAQAKARQSVAESGEKSKGKKRRRNDMSNGAVVELLSSEAEICESSREEGDVHVSPKSKRRKKDRAKNFTETKSDVCEVAGTGNSSENEVEFVKTVSGMCKTDENRSPVSKTPKDSANNSTETKSDSCKVASTEKSSQNETEFIKAVSGTYTTDENISPKSKKRKKNKTVDKLDETGKAPSQEEAIVNDTKDEDPLDQDVPDGDDADVPERFNDNSTFTTSKEVAGFTIFGSVQEQRKKKVKRVLPDWLANPTVFGADLQKGSSSVDDIVELDRDLIKKLKMSGIRSFFPVQQEVIPWLIKDNKDAYCKRPRDVCVSAPTGSGKTLAFALPVIQCLKSRIVTAVRALVVLPVHDLAIQIFDVFQRYCKGTSLKVVLLSGHKPFAEEQASLIRESVRGPLSLADIVVSTPGRLVDHIRRTRGFSLKLLRFLIIDEADRMMEEVGHMWLQEVQKAVFGSNFNAKICQCSDTSLDERFLDTELTPCSIGKVTLPFQKLLFSATLSQDPEKLGQLLLFRPKLFTCITKRKEQIETKNVINSSVSINGFKQKKGEFVGKYTTPEELKEYYVLCSVELKPLIVWYFLECKKFRRVLCFTGSIENAHRLYHILKHVEGVTIAEFSSNLKTKLRQNILKKFAAGEIDVLICSDIIARGMDVENVDYVISYDPATFIKTYIHRIGRTARAGREGTAITLLHRQQLKPFQKMINSAGKKNVKRIPVSLKELKPLEAQYKRALADVSDIVQSETKMKYKRKSIGLTKPK